MGPKRSAEAWHWTEDVFAPANFCVLALLRDGLRVSPFDQHPDGDAALRTLGLDADGWLQWLRAVVDAHADLGAQVLDVDPHPKEVPTVITRPSDLCPGDPALRRLLNDMWIGRQAGLEVWKRSMSGDPAVRERRGTSSQQRGRWASVAAFGDRLPPLSVLLVSYPVPVVMTLPPKTCVISPAPDADGYSAQLVAAASTLSALIPA